MIRNYTKTIIGISVGLLLSSYVYATAGVPPVTQEPSTSATTANPSNSPNQMPGSNLQPSTTDLPTDPNANTNNNQQDSVNNSLKTLENKLKASQDNKMSGSVTGTNPNMPGSNNTTAPTSHSNNN